MTWNRNKRGTWELRSRGSRIAFIVACGFVWYVFIDEVTVHSFGPFATEQLAKKACREEIRKRRKNTPGSLG